jgi:hypothetical protein
MLARVSLESDLARIAAAALPFSQDGEELAGVIAAEPYGGRRVYLCAFRDGDERVGWLALDDDGGPVATRALVRETASIVALCELAEENAGGGQLEELRAQLVTLRLTENPLGIEEAEAAALALEHVIGASQRVASPDYLDAIGAATRELELALGQPGSSPFSEAMKESVEIVEVFVRDVELGYKLELAG